jgi:hypothetical protein
MPIDRKGTTTSPLSIPMDEPTTARLVVVDPGVRSAPILFLIARELILKYLQSVSSVRARPRCAYRINRAWSSVRFVWRWEPETGLSHAQQRHKSQPQQATQIHRNPAYPCGFRVA